MDRRKLIGTLGLAPAMALPGSAQGHPEGKPGVGPLSMPHLHFCGIHMAKANPKLQFITQHYCASHTGGKTGMFSSACFLTGERKTQNWWAGDGA